MAKTSGYAANGELQMYYEVHGEPVPGTRPLLLIHGGGNTIESNWQHLIPLVTPTRQVIAIEEEGHGRTQPIDRELTSEASADDVAAVLTQLHAGPVDVLGFSAGGSTALAFAMRHPSLIGRMIVASSFFRRDGMIDGFWDGLAAGTLSDMPQGLQDADLALNGGDRAHLQRLFDLDSQRMLRSIDVPDDSLAAITTPTLVVVGDRDVVRVDHALRMSQTIPDARLLVLPAIHGDYLGEINAAPDGGSDALERTVPWLLAFLDA
jgi:pimeloyl-ACP methyl ester carboxylesterase